MTLRLRLVLAIVVLVTVGLGVFGVATYSLYARSGYQRLDDQLRSAVNPVAGELFAHASFPDGRSGNDLGGGSVRDEGRRESTPVAAYGELRDADGRVLSRVQPVTSSSRPAVPGSFRAQKTGRFMTTGSVTGSTRWRIYLPPLTGSGDLTVVVALPTSDTAASLRRLGIIEALAASILLLLVAAGSWLILRRGLRPLEHMATSARSITAGDLSQRVTATHDSTEVGQLGLALNTMLGEIETAFREREASEQRLRQFLADASHELRTPLTSIQGFAELFRVGGDQDRVELSIILRRIEDEAARMTDLVEDLLLLARLDETRPAARAPVDLAVLAADACTDAVAVAPDRGVTLDAPEPVVALGDQDHLRQAIANLIANAVRHTPPGTPIEVVAVARDGSGVVSVRDHGPGLDPPALAHVFDRFWQADGARSGQGAGLGLSIVAAIAEEHGGSAVAENVEGGGARFTLRVPLPAPPRTAVEDDRASFPANSQPGPRTISDRTVTLDS